jgi:hypothetical protein
MTGESSHPETFLALTSMLDADGTLPVDQAVEFVRLLAVQIGELHRSGQMHGCVMLDRLYVAPEGIPHLSASPCEHWIGTSGNPFRRNSIPACR